MKKLLLIISFATLILSTQGQQLPGKASKPVSTKDTIIQGVKFPLYIGAKGGKYILVTSKKGTEYKKYFKN